MSGDETVLKQTAPQLGLVPVRRAIRRDIAHRWRTSRPVDRPADVALPRQPTRVPCQSRTRASSRPYCAQTDGRCASDASGRCAPAGHVRTSARRAQRAPLAEGTRNARKVLMTRKQLALPDASVARGFRRAAAAALQRLGSAGYGPALSRLHALGACDSIALHVVRCAWHSSARAGPNQRQ